MGYFFLEGNQIASKYWATGHEFDITKRFCGLKNNKNKKHWHQLPVTWMEWPQRILGPLWLPLVPFLPKGCACIDGSMPLLLIYSA